MDKVITGQSPVITTGRAFQAVQVGDKKRMVANLRHLLNQMAAEFRFSLEICASLVIVQVYGSTFTSVPRISILHIAIFLVQTRV